MEENQLKVMEIKNDMEKIIHMIPSGINVFLFYEGKIKLLICNPAMARLMGRQSTNECIRCADEEINRSVHPQDREHVLEEMHKLFSEEHACSFTYRVHNFKTGKSVWLYASGVSELQEDGSQIGYVSYCDISDRKEAEEEVKKSRQRLEAAVMHSGLQYWEYDICRNRAILSDKSCGDFQMGNIIENFPEAWLKTGYTHPDDVEEYRRMIGLVKEGRPYVEWISRSMNLQSGAYQWMKIRLTTIFDEENRPVHAVATAEDVHAHMELENRFIHTLVQNGIQAWDFDMQRMEMIRYHYKGENELFVSEEEVIKNVPQAIISGGGIYPDDIENYLDLYRKIYKGEAQACSKVRVWIEEKKKYVWQEFIFTVIYDLNKNPVRALCSSRDISEEKQMEQRFLEENRYREEIASSMLSTCRLNLTAGKLEELMINGVNVPCSEKLSSTIDYRERSAYYLTQSEISDGDNEKLNSDYLLSRFAKEEQTVSVEYNARKLEDGRLIRIHVDCKVLRRPETGDVIAFFYESDVTQDFWLKNIMNSIVYDEYDMIGIIFASSNTVYTRAKEGGSSLAHLKSNVFDSICSQFLREFACTDDMEALVKSMKLLYIMERLETEETYAVEFSLRESDGSIRRKEVRFSYIDRKEKLIAVSRRDIEDMVREEKAKQERLEQALNLAEHANSAKSEFLARMSHEMRTPMNAIVGLLSLAEHETGDNEALQDYLEKMDISSRHLMNLINDVLDMSKIESGELVLHPKECCFKDLVESLQAVIRPLCDQKKIHFWEEGEHRDEIICVDELRFNQVFLNLLSNAVKFTREGGNIWFRYHSVIKGGFLDAEFEVCDDGIGMSEEFQKHMFEPFTQEGREYTQSIQGTGLGLSISKAIVEKAGGTLTVESSLSHGTCFRILVNMPLAEGRTDENAKHETKRKNSDVSLTGKRVLLVEDHPMNQLIAKRILNNNGVTVITAGNGRESVELFEKSEPGYFDAVLMDIRMPKMDGITAARVIRRLERSDAQEIPIIAMTANAFDEDVRKTKEAGMNAHLAKPIEPSLMLHTLAEWIGRKERKEHATGFE